MKKHKKIINNLVSFALLVFSALGISTIGGWLSGRPVFYQFFILGLLTFFLVSFFFSFMNENSIIKRGNVISLIILVVLLIAIVFRPPTEQENIIQLINNEAIWSKQKNIDKIMTLFDDNAYVADAQGGIWNGSEGIRNRYEWIFGHQDYILLRHVDIKVAVEGKDALVTCSTEGLFLNEVGEENPIHGGKDSERWVLEQINGEWKVIAFVYNLC